MAGHSFALVIPSSRQKIGSVMDRGPDTVDRKERLKPTTPYRFLKLAFGGEVCSSRGAWSHWLINFYHLEH